MSFLKKIVNNLPEVSGPTQKRLSFKEKVKWTLIILVIFFLLGLIPLFGLGANALQQFEYLSIILGAEFGSLISLGIGPIVTASIILQLLNGSGILKFDLSNTEGKQFFQGIQKLLAIFFIIFEAAIYVFMGGLSPMNFAEAAIPGTSLFFGLQLLLILQLMLGGALILFMDEVISKWGFGSGISLFIAAGVSKSIFIQAFNFFPSASSGASGYLPGKIPQLFQALAAGDMITVGLSIAAVLSTVLVFMLAVYVQSMKVEIPLSFGRMRGHGMRWPLSFMYTSNIPVILVAALLANIQLWARLLENWGYPLLGTFSASGTPMSGLVMWLFHPDIVSKLIMGNIVPLDFARAIVYILIMVVGAVVFSWFWVQTSGMDAKSQAKQIMNAGLQIPGFRKDMRVLERVLQRYISPLTVMGAISVGFLAAFADLSGALSRGTGILLTVMIIYKLYEEIAKQHMMDMNPMMKKFIKG